MVSAVKKVYLQQQHEDLVEKRKYQQIINFNLKVKSKDIEVFGINPRSKQILLCLY